MTHFSTIGLIGHLNNERAVYSIERLIRFLQQRGKDFVLEVETAARISDIALTQAARQIMDMDALGQICDLVIVVGGDGSLLSGARALAKYQVPLLGVNRGRLGFLTDITPEQIEQKMAEVLTGQFASEKRFLLDMEVRRDGQVIALADALNDVVLHTGQFIHMLEFEIHVDGSFVTSQRSDGLIVSTPTGSTAYSLSGGGPILHPKLDAIVIVPMNPHTLSSRPIVVSGDSEILLMVGEHNRALPMVTCDGHSHAEVQTGDEIIIRKKPQLLELLHPLDYNFYERCRSKLGWGGHLLKPE
ncbi:NAD(+) kinase [Cellvibrio japonicus]|uniref:NAD kinase n=1 Tax=Cellvibrio japonicus (strain Ueda107) TaxID=498211 RepID=NADK_CELJU|nr:NAD(+) kinase [Cellvibrio japonicus]B3PJ64.1 RecName: Full=NAD kinase; AltName: Full=ATP-dependent NAD kinase [Cellvibrio japonicus Ueda107]ACE86035.1 Predicted sugar kinase [Cellvibrio japonicus Ueda107]QEI12626.1 NAD(+) kinase [Cellvibrio japonicus]QEI16200.1 NAD(+) kinase [Cellvibrio japonicus]QEI19778.1 NAD(+) kinase [Cellvibrio japonicus]